ncbi:MAG: hypothetical protein NC485_10260 [Ruminococcus flavefaciens]|nr:hypothetical protein [Ruminococcus flavefaciens]MCM1059280.1 hypothetical protein [Eubacterium sp.]
MKKMIYIIILALTNLMCITACSSITESINTQAAESSSIETEYNIELNSENVSTTIEIDSKIKSELINIIECYYHLKDLIGGRYCYITGHYETRNLNNEYSSNEFKYDMEIKYCKFDTLDDFYSIYEELFFRNNKAIVFSSSNITRNDYEEMALSYMTMEFYNKNFYGIFDDIIDDDNYISPSKYWYCNGNLLINLSSDYIYGGINDYNYFTIDKITNNSVVITTVRKYSELDSHVQFSFVLENNLWKLSDIYYLD